MATPLALPSCSTADRCVFPESRCREIGSNPVANLPIGCNRRIVEGRRNCLGISKRLRIGEDTAAGRNRRMATSPEAVWEARVEPKQTWIPLELIASETEFDQVLSEARERNEPVVIDWMAAWCRKCLYLKPKLEKLAANYHPNIRFYYVDVNNVPQALVKRAEVTQMPTIQLWRDGASQAEVIGGQQAATVLDQIRDMISKNESLPIS